MSTKKYLLKKRQQLPSLNFNSTQNTRLPSQSNIDQNQTSSKLFKKYPQLIKIDLDSVYGKSVPRQQNILDPTALLQSVNASLSSARNESSILSLVAKINKKKKQQLFQKGEKIYMKAEDMIKFQGYNLSFLTSKGARVKNAFESSIKQSTNIITRQIIDDFIELQTKFDQFEQVNGKELTFKILSNDRENFLEKTIIPTNSSLDMNEFLEQTEEEQLDTIINLLKNRINYVSDSLYDITQFCLQSLKAKIIQKTRSISLYFLATLIQSFLFEAFGKAHLALRTLQHLLYYSNIYKLYSMKPIIYYRIGVSYLKMNNYTKSLIIGKKLLKQCWYNNNKPYEVKSYYILARANLMLGNSDDAQLFYDRYFNHHIQSEGYNKQLGIKYLSAEMKDIEYGAHKNSRSHDDFDLDLLLNEDRQQRKELSQKIYINKQMEIYDQHLSKMMAYQVGQKEYFEKVGNKNDCDICRHKINGVKIEKNQQVFFKQNCKSENFLSSNRNFAAFYSEQSPYVSQNNEIQQIYKPDHSVPILVQVLDLFKKNYLNKFGQKQ